MYDDDGDDYDDHDESSCFSNQSSSLLVERQKI